VPVQHGASGRPPPFIGQVGGSASNDYLKKEPPDDGKTDSSTMHGVKLRVLVVTWLSRTLYGEQRGQRGLRAPSFGLCRLLAFIA
jgi:hypothetical protein